MCDLQTKLVAWLDGELPEEETIELKRHVACCNECESQLALYRQVSGDFTLYCNAVTKPDRSKVFRWVPVGALAVAAAVVLFLYVPRWKTNPPPAIPPKAELATVSVLAPESPVQFVQKVVRKKRAVHSTKESPANWQPTEQTVERTIQIAIPAEAIFPPGAIPEGVNLIAELRIAPDGSVHQVLLRP